MKFTYSRYVAFDVETHSPVAQEYQLQPWRVVEGRANISCYAMSWFTQNSQIASESVFGYPVNVPYLRSILRNWAAEKKIVVGWNIPFDIAWLIANGLRDEVHAIQWLDVMNLWKRVDSHKLRIKEERKITTISFGLKAAVKEFFPDRAGYEAKISFDKLPQTLEEIAEFRRYNESDTENTLLLLERFCRELEDEELRNARIEALCLDMTAETRILGINVNPAKVAALDRTLTDRMVAAYKELCILSPEIQDYNLASPQQLSQLLFTQWGLPEVKKTDNGNASTDKEVLHELAFMDPRAKLLNEFRRCANWRAKFVRSTQDSLTYNGGTTTHPEPVVLGTYTGRMTYYSKQGKNKDEKPTGVALHQWKRDPAVRDMVEAPEGFLLAEWDFSGQEYRWMAVESNDEVMLSLCQPGEDGHSYMGAQIAGCDYRELQARVKAEDPQAKDDRQLGKVGNLSLGYRTSAPKLKSVARVQYGIPMDDVTAKRVWTTYRQTYLMVPKYWERQIHRGKRDGYVTTLAGRRLDLQGSWVGDSGWGLESSAINFPIQGVGADQKYLALAVMRDRLRQIGGYFYFDYHDGLYAILPIGVAEREVLKIQVLLSNLPYKKAWGIDLPIPFPVDAKLGKTWGSLRIIE